MAGIGFVLRRVVAEETYSSVFKGYLAAAVISSGPWFIAVFTMALLGVVSSGFLPAEERNLFFSAVSYSFAFSLIMTGLVMMPATRMVADLLYSDGLRRVTPMLLGLLVAVLPIQMASLSAVFMLSGVGVAYALTVGTIYVAVSGIWLTMIFLSAAKSYGPIVWSFALGYALSFGANYVFGSLWGPLGAVAGFALGQSLTFVLLWLRVIEEFGLPTTVNFGFYRYVLKFPSLVAIGLLYNIGVWIDNIMLWFTGDGLQVVGLIHVHPLYDTATFLAFLTAMPAMALFLIQVETRFYIHYRDFYRKLNNKATRRELMDEKREMGKALVGSYLSLLRLQTVIVALGLVFAPAALDVLGLPEAYLFSLRLGIISVGLHVFLSITILMLLYFNMRSSPVIVLAVFVAINVVGTAWTIHMGFQWYGFGFLAAEAVATALAILALANRFSNLEYLTFARQPITAPERAAFAPPIPMAQDPAPEKEEPQKSTPRAAMPQPTEAKVTMPQPLPEGEAREAMLTAPTTLEELPKVREWLRTVLGEWEVSREAGADLALAVTEVCTNRIEHEYRARAIGEFQFELTKRGVVIRVAIVDEAPPFQPGEIRPPAPEALAGGGYGLFLVDSLMDDVSFEGVGNVSRVVLTKFDTLTEEES
ncbi:MAG: exopolysaccharide Pel transporter PelG [Chloroflexi bacterium]|nr:exopolysaccharide Pel transporter PelG [Chloroflexota bacterium]